MLITDEYRKLNEDLHTSNKDYGTCGQNWASQVMSLTKLVKSTDLLDYGCGKSTLAQNLPFAIKQYDPCILKHSTPPEPADIVICTDVLEHIEPACLKDVMLDLRRVTKKLLFLHIANGAAKKTLEDGRNAHLIQEDDLFWDAHLYPLFRVLQFNGSGLIPDEVNKGVIEYIYVCAPWQTTY